MGSVPSQNKNLLYDDINMAEFALVDSLIFDLIGNSNSREQIEIDTNSLEHLVVLAIKAHLNPTTYLN